MSREIRQELDISRRVYALARRLAGPVGLPPWNVIGTMSDQEHANLVKNTHTSMTLTVERLKVQLKEANDALAALAQGQEQGQELPGDSEWVSVHSVV